MNGYKNAYDEKILSRSREKACELGKPYVNWAEYRPAPVTWPYYMTGMLVLAGLLAYALTLVM